MNLVIQIYRTLNILSIDVAAGAMIGTIYFSQLLKRDFDLPSLALLGITVWIIYTVDHLLDAKSFNKPATTSRHKFHQEHFKTLQRFVFGCVVGCLVLLFFVNRSVLHWGVALFALVAFYILMNRKLQPIKEIIISVLYTSGILLPAFIDVDWQTLLSIIIIQVAHFFLIVLTNLLLFSWFEAEFDKAQRTSSFAVRFGKSVTGKLITMFFILQFGLLACQLWSNSLELSVVIMTSMSTGLFIIFLWADYFGLSIRYRLMGDSVFLFPIAIIFQ